MRPKLLGLALAALILLGGAFTRHANLSVELGAPGSLVGPDQQPQAAVGDSVASRGALPTAPVRQAVRDPAAFIHGIVNERVLELQLVSSARKIPDHRWPLLTVKIRESLLFLDGA